MTDALQGVARPRLAAGALFGDDRGRVLLVRPSYKPGCEIPGGYVEAGESPRDACIREVREELGIQPAIGGLLVVDWAPHPEEGDKLLFIFDGGALDAATLDAIRLDPQELQGHAFYDATDLERVLVPRLARRVIAALDVRSSRRGGEYLEHGQRGGVIRGA